MSALGRHILVEFFGCSSEILNEVVTIEQGMVAAAEKAGATVINSTFHHFSPYGVSGVVVIQESHLAIHTWPEFEYAAVDLFTCGDAVNPWTSFDHLKEVFQAKNYSALEMRRGAIDQLKRVNFEVKDQIGEAYKNPEKFNRSIWFTDRDDNQALSLRHKGDLLFKEKTPYQTVKVYDTFGYGKMLAIDNMVMCTERDEFHYHEMIVHPGVFAHGNVKNVLVIGGGDGGTVRELLQHDSVDHIDMIEIDEAVVRASKEYLPSLSSGLDDPKVNLEIGDGIQYVKDCEANQYDLVIVDGSDPVGPAEGLFSEAFYTDCKRVLKDDGILVAQGESPKFNEKSFVELNTCFKNIFGAEKVKTLLFYATTYPTGMWSLQMGVKGAQDPMNIDENAVADFVEKKHLKYYNEQIHKASFMLPNFVKDMLHERVVQPQ